MPGMSPWKRRRGNRCFPLVSAWERVNPSGGLHVNWIRLHRLHVNLSVITLNLTREREPLVYVGECGCVSRVASLMYGNMFPVTLKTTGKRVLTVINPCLWNDWNAINNSEERVCYAVCGCVTC